MFGTERGQIIPPKEITAARENPFRVGVALEKVPELVEEIEINPLAKDLLPTEYQFLTSPDFWRDRAILSVPFDKGETRLMSPRTWGRAVPMGYGQIPYGEFVGGSLMMKGIFRSGFYYSTEERSNPKLPVGFFGRNDAYKEQLMGNNLLEIGFRSSLPIVTIIYESEAMRKFLLDRWNKSAKITDDIELCFGLIGGNGDQPAAFGRLTGVECRWDQLVHQKNEGEYFYRRSEMVWASSLWLAEASLFPEHFQNYLMGLDITLPKVLEVLEKVISRRKLNREEFLVFAKLNVGILGNNVRRLKSGIDGNKVLKLSPNLGKVLAASKDNCLAWISQDYEEAEFSKEESENVVPWRYIDALGNLNNQNGFVYGDVADILLEGGLSNFTPGEFRAMMVNLFSSELQRIGIWVME